MRSHDKLEVSVGAFVLAGSLALAYLSLSLGGLELGKGRYTLSARFSSVGELAAGDAVKVAGVAIGEVRRIALVDYAAEVELAIDRDLRLPEDTIASIRTEGLLGDAYISLSPGAADADLASGGRLVRTEPAVSLTELIAKYAFGGDKGGGSDLLDEDTKGGALVEPEMKP